VHGRIQKETRGIGCIGGGGGNEKLGQWTILEGGFAGMFSQPSLASCI
jgi:hypothetical protein